MWLGEGRKRAQIHPEVAGFVDNDALMHSRDQVLREFVHRKTQLDQAHHRALPGAQLVRSQGLHGNAAWQLPLQALPL